MFTQFHNPKSLHGELLDFYLANGWFRSGQYIYTTKVLNFDGKLYSPIRIRLPLENYEFRKSLRKFGKKINNLKLSLDKHSSVERKKNYIKNINYALMDMSLKQSKMLCKMVEKRRFIILTK